MDIKTKLLVSKFKNNSYFTNLSEYIQDKVNNDNLSYENLKYIYNNLYRGHSEFIKQNIYPVCEFLKEGYTFEETEKIAGLLSDATGKTVFCYNEREKGDKYNKLFCDLKFAYDVYDRYIKLGNSKEKAFEIVKNEIELTDENQRFIENSISMNKLYETEAKSSYKEISKEMDKLRDQFEKSSSNDKKLSDYFNNSNNKPRTYTNIVVAGVILAGIDVRNLQRENNNLDGEMEKYPYNEEQLKMIDRYDRLDDTLQKIEQYMEMNYTQEESFEDEMER